MENKIKILKASAGSGKTFALAREYIKLLIESGDPYAYRHILAVTFTNKATDEMKRRIIKELDILASCPGKSQYLSDLKAETGKTGDEISSLSRSLLFNLLNDYSAFSVSTIDRFFQRVLKAFSREIGQFASYQVELDKKSLIKESVDRILDSLEEKDEKMLKWLSDSAREKLDNGGRYDMGKSLYDMAEALKTEEYRGLVEENGIDEEKAFSREALAALKKRCTEIIGTFIADLKRTAGAVAGGFGDAGVALDDTKGHFMKALLKAADVKSPADVSVPSPTFMKNAADPDLWFRKDNAWMLQKVSHLAGPLGEYCSLFGSRFIEFRTADIIRDQIYALGLYSEINASFDALVKEKNVLSLDDSNTILKGIIDGCDAPFIYEKLGVRFEHFLIDEFQDTSRIQWENFRPLLENSVASGNADLIVGDVKQSIYRWRDSDWNLLDREVGEEFGLYAEEEHLQSNWRSTRKIIEFNNGFYPFAASALDDILGERCVSDIYADVEQIPMSAGDACGNVKVIFCKTSASEDDTQMDAVLEEIKRLETAGARYSDIGILVRANAKGTAVASALLEHGYPVISDEALSVKSSLAVRRLVALMSYANNMDSRLNSFLASSMEISGPGEWHSLVDLCEYFIREMKVSLKTDFGGEVPYLHAFMDTLQEWVNSNGNSLADFLDYWEDADPKIISPADADAIRIMSIHKSKGLSFPYVIFPYAQCTLYQVDEHWCHPAVENTGLEMAGGGVFRVSLSGTSASSYFSDSYENERKMQVVDNINTFYVATTRAEKGMTVIAPSPSSAYLSGKETYKKMSDILYDYVSGDGSGFRNVPAHPESGGVPYSGEDTAFLSGEEYVFMKRESSGNGGSRPGSYESYPLNPEEGKSRLQFSGEAGDFFSESGEVGIEASGRLRGVVLHDIMSRTIVAGDLDRAVMESFRNGSIDRKEMDEIRALLAESVASGTGRGWFPEDRSKVVTETTVIDSDGGIYRPDRVVLVGEKVIVVDYKFGKHENRYLGQVRKYAGLYRRMGYSDVEAFLWYVETDEVVKA